MSRSIDPFYSLHSRHCSLVIDCREDAATLLYWGPRLQHDTRPEMLAQLSLRQEAQACVETEAPIALTPEFGAGFLGNAGLQIHRNGQAWATYSRLQSVSVDSTDNRLRLLAVDKKAQIELCHSLQLDSDSDVLCATTSLRNLGTSPLWVEQCSAPCIPVPQHYDRILGFEGRWSHEFQLQRVERFLGCYVRESRAGRTSHDSFPGVVLHTAQTHEGSGDAYGLHLGWSGNHRLCVEEKSDGRVYAQLGELLHPGELQLAAGEEYISPTLYGSHSSQGFSGLSQQFHRYVRGQLTDARMTGKQKPVHFNTWEAMYFDLDVERLCQLADAAAEVGVERFVLDDGWFRGRDSDRAALGDWYVDSDKFPQGLTPLIEHVHARGMEFGLWVEPEMVNPDSDLYRAHPDWALGVEGAPRVMFRHQLVLDLSRQEVQDYLFERLDALLSEYPITYLKWDMNRDLNQPGGQTGQASTHRQTLALYQLLQRVRSAHPNVEIESCSSGGARADYGILRYTDRVWTSDSNDALDRLRIQKGFSFFFPPEFMGSHVGPYDCHITGRHLSMATRAGVAMFGDMGIEANLLQMDAAEKAELTAAVALHKRHRQLILGGRLERLDLPEHEHGFGVIAEDGGEALFSYTLLATHPNSAPGRLRLRGLAQDASYRVQRLWPAKLTEFSASGLRALEGQVMSGEALQLLGLQLPIMRPENLLVLHLERV